MVFKPFTHLARQSFAKHLVNGTYAQSVVAATQSSYATTTAVPLVRGGQNVPARINTAFGNAGSNAPGGKSGSGGENVASFHAAQNGDDGEKEQKRYLFSKKILWSKAQHQTAGVLQKTENTRSPSLSRSFSAAALDPEAREELQALAGEENAVEETVEARAAVAEDVDSEVSTEFVDSATGESVSTARSDISVDVELAKLEAEGQWDAIETTFKQRVKDGQPQTVAAYNHLISAATSRGVDDASITKVLNIFEDLVHAKIAPDVTTYTKIINYLVEAARDRLQASTEIEQANASFSFNGIVPTRVPANGRELMGYAVSFFYQSAPRKYDTTLYQTLVDGCAAHGMLTDMVNIYEHMESLKIRPNYDILLTLLRGFSEVGDIDSALHVYDELSYDSTKYVSEHGQLDPMFSYMLNTYIVAGKLGAALDFFKRIVESEVCDTTTLNTLIATMVIGFAKRGDHATAYDWFLKLVGQSSLNRLQHISQALFESAKTSNAEYERKWFELLMTEISHSSEPVLQRNAPEIVSSIAAYLAQSVKENRMEDCNNIWNASMTLQARKLYLPAAPVVLYAFYLVEQGLVDKAISVVKHFGSTYHFSEMGFTSKEYDASSISGLIEALVRSRSVSPVQLVAFARGVSDAGLKFGPNAANEMLAAFDDAALAQLTWNDLEFLLRFVALNLPVGRPADRSIQRLRGILDFIMAAGLPLEGNTQEIVNLMLGRIGNVFGSEYLKQWSIFLDTASAAVLPMQHAVQPATYSFNEIDVRKSKQLLRLAEGANDFNEVMTIFNSTRKAGYVFLSSVYSKCIARAQRDGRYDAVFAIYNAAESDLPLDISQPASIESWSAIYDSMIAAELNRSDFEAAKFFHQKLAAIGGVASANTYGLYIVSLKQSQDLYDEATEAVQIMERAKAEGVAPTPFLYNAVIGRLARARRIDDCLYYFSEMRRLNLRPTSVTYGTMINALCRVSDERFAEELFDEMEAQANYKPRAAPYNSIMQYFISTAKRDRTKVLEYYNRMLARGIKPTAHTYKLLIEAYAELPPPNLAAAKAVMETMRQNNEPVNSSHHAVIIHALGCVLSDPDGALDYFNDITSKGLVEEDNTLYQALLESLVANHRTRETPVLLKRMAQKNVPVTAYIANTLIHGWAREKDLTKAKHIYECVGPRREPSTYEYMTRALLSMGDREGARAVVSELLSRGYPAAVTGKIVELLRGGGEWEVQISPA